MKAMTSETTVLERLSMAMACLVKEEAADDAGADVLGEKLEPHCSINADCAAGYVLEMDKVLLDEYGAYTSMTACVQ